MNSELLDLQCDLGDLRQAFKELQQERDALLDEVRRLTAIIEEIRK